MAKFNVGDRVLWNGYERTVVVAEPDRYGRIVTIGNGGGYVTAHEDDLTPAPPPDPRDVIRAGMEAMRLTREYAEPAVRLPATEGWSWFDWVTAAADALGEDVPDWVNPPPDTRDVVDRESTTPGHNARKAAQ